MAPPAPPSGVFVLTDAGFEATATWTQEGPGQALGPDLALHDVDLIRFEFDIERLGDLKNPEPQVWKIGREPNGPRLLSLYSDCPSWDGDGRCTQSEDLLLPISEETLFFGAPLVLPHLPEGTGNFTVPLWRAGEVVEVELHARVEGDAVYVSGQPAVERFVLSTSANGSPLDCDVFEGDVLIVFDDVIGCENRPDTWRWWVARPVPTIQESWPPDVFAPPLEVDAVEHGVPEGSGGLSLPLPEALQRAREEAPDFREVLVSDGWALSSARYTTPAGRTAGSIGCQETEVSLTVAEPQGDRASATVSQEICNENTTGQTLTTDDQVAQEDPPTNPRIPDTRLSVRIDDGVELASQLVCQDVHPDSRGSFNVFTLPYALGDRPWLVISGPGYTNVWIDASSGFVLNAERHAEGDGPQLYQLFSGQRSLTCHGPDRPMGQPLT